jgi:ferredoxin
MTAVDPVYRELARKLKSENSNYVPLILERLLSVEEARIVLALPSSPRELAEKMGLEEETLKRQLQSLYERGAIFFTRKGIRPPHSLVEYHDATTTNRKFDEFLGEEFFELWDKWSLEESGRFMVEAKPLVWKTDPPMRVFAKWKSIKDVPGVMWFDDIRQLLKREKETLGINPCACLRIAKKRFPDFPEDLCMLSGRTAIYSVERGSGRKTTVKEMLDILESLEKYPLIHLGYNERPFRRLIGNSPACCLAFEMSPPGVRLASTNPSRFQAKADPDLCLGCDSCKCMDVCLFDAFEVKEDPASGSKRAHVDAEKCMGCGNCVLNCCIGAVRMKLIRPPEFVPEAFEGYY